MVILYALGNTDKTKSAAYHMPGGYATLVYKRKCFSKSRSFDSNYNTTNVKYDTANVSFRENQRHLLHLLNLNSVGGSISIPEFGRHTKFFTFKCSVEI